MRMCYACILRCLYFEIPLSPGVLKNAVSKFHPFRRRFPTRRGCLSDHWGSLLLSDLLLGGGGRDSRFENRHVGYVLIRRSRTICARYLKATFPTVQTVGPDAWTGPN